jgi:hypothetical protein
MEMYNVPYKKRKIPHELENFCAECDKKFNQIRGRLAGRGGYTQVAYWLEGDVIDASRKIAIQRKNQYNLHIDWSQCENKLIEGVRYYHDDGLWHTLPAYIKALFTEYWPDDVELQESGYKQLSDGCIVSFGKMNCRDAIYWAMLPSQLTMDGEGDYDMGASSLANSLLAFASHVMMLELSMARKRCLGFWNLPFLNMEESGDFCEGAVKYKSDKGYYLCEECGHKHAEMFGRISTLK